MSKRILIIQGHPDASQQHYGHALAAAYEQGARSAGHEIRNIQVATLDFPILRSYDDFYKGDAIPLIKQCQDDFRWADHVVMIYPLWMGSMPALLKAFIEQLFRPGFAMQSSEDGKSWTKLLKGKSAHIIVTMGMPAIAYRWFYGAHSLKSLERNILKFSGMGPIRESLIGLVETSPGNRQRWLEKMHKMGGAGQ
ncbi:MAG: flavodoxin family protein [Gammaproteobacteria bacterium]|nr:MAG: flavodoxin family protein [Gammaproteobacteria bacterium]